MAFEARRDGRSTAGGAPSRTGLVFGGGFALGALSGALALWLLGPAAPVREGVEDLETEAAQPSAAAPAEQESSASAALQPSAAEPAVAAVDPVAPQPTAAEPPPAEPVQAAAAPSTGTPTTASATGEPVNALPGLAPTAAPTGPGLTPPAPARPTAAARAPVPAPATAAAPITGAPRPVASAAPAAPTPPAAAAPRPTPARPEAPVDPNSQDAKLAAAAVGRPSDGTRIDNMLEQALTPGSRKADAPAAQAALPAAPTRDDVVKAMSVLVPAIRGCAQGQSGLAPVSIVVHNDGRVESAALSSGPFFGTASGRCMEGVVRRARFPRFSQPSFRVQFPFAVQ